MTAVRTSCVVCQQILLKEIIRLSDSPTGEPVMKILAANDQHSKEEMVYDLYCGDCGIRYRINE